MIGAGYKGKPERGFTYVEMMIATAILAVALIPVMQSLQIAGDAGTLAGTAIDRQLSVQSGIDSVLAEDFDTLLAAATAANSAGIATSFSDPVAAEPRRLVYISFYDADNSDLDGDPFTIADDDSDADGNPYTNPNAAITLLWVKVQIKGTRQSLQVLTRE